jgi:O-antigen ligase
MVSEHTEPAVNYWAVSILRSRTAWLNAAALIVAILSLTEVREIIPADYASTVAAVLAVLNIYLRTQTIRPVAMIGLNETVSVEVPKVGTAHASGLEG